MTIRRNYLSAGWGILVFSLAAHAAPVHSTSQSSPSTIALVELPPRRVAFVQHVGPYWTLGRVITETSQQMADRQHKSPLFIRYATDPGKTKPGQLAVEVGFVLLKDEETSPPFLSRAEPASTAITLTTNEPTISPRVAYAELLQWAHVHDLTPVGPMTELHYAVDGRDSPARATKLVFQMPLVSADSATRPSPRGISNTHATETEPFQRFIDDGWIPEAPQSVEHANVPPSSEVRLDANRPGNRASVVEAEEAGSLPNEASPDAAVNPGIKDTESFVALFASANYDSLARRLMPGRNERTGATLVWLGQLSFRITAAAKGLQSQYPDEAKPLLGLSNALRARHAQLAGSRRADALQHATARIDGLNQEARTQLTQIMRSVDRLLARIAFKQVSPSSANTEIVELLEQTATILDAAAP